jgi:hypothetical protein
MTDEKKDTPRMQSNSTSSHGPEQIRKQAEEKAKAQAPSPPGQILSSFLFVDANSVAKHKERQWANRITRTL